MTTPPTTVWYAAYGSNLLAERLACYLVGGVAPGADGQGQAGARDPRPPRVDRADFLPHRLFFADRARSWQNGGVAYLDPSVDPACQTLARLYLLSAEQFEDVVRQENDDPALAIDWSAVARQTSHAAAAGPYGQILFLGERDGVPVLTCTGTKGPAEADLRPPSANYLRCIIAGLRQGFGLNKRGVKRACSELPGIAGQVDSAFLGRLFDEAGELLEELALLEGDGPAELS